MLNQIFLLSLHIGKGKIVNPMRRFIIFGVVSAALLIAIIIGVFGWLRTNKTAASEALQAIPLNAGMVVKVNSFTHFYSALRGESSIWSDLKQFNLLASADNTFLLFDSLCKVEPTIEQLLNSSNLFVSTHIVGKNELQLLFAVNLPKGISSSEVESLFKKHLDGAYQFTEKNFNGANVIFAAPKANTIEGAFALTISRGVVLGSTNSLLLENAIKQMANPQSLATDNGFQEILKTAGKKIDANVFINHKFFPPLFSKYISDEYRGAFQGFFDLALWTELDPTIKPEAIFFNGFSQAPDSINAYYQILAKQKPIKMTLQDVLPFETAAILFVGISNLDTYLQDYRKYIDRNGNLRDYKRKNEELKKAIGIEPLSFYSTFFNKEIALAHVPFGDLKDEDCWFIVANTKGSSLTKEELLKSIDFYASRNGEKASSYERTLKIDKDKSVKIYKFLEGKFHKTLFGSLFDIANDKYFTIVDSYVVFGYSFEALSRFVLANVHNKQLKNDAEFRDFSQSLHPESNLTFYLSPRRGQGLFNQFLHKQNSAHFIKNSNFNNSIQGLALQLIGGKQMVFNNICIRRGQGASPQFSVSAPQTVWETRLDTSINRKPLLFINHNSRNREIFVQDNRNIIYLINDAGRILWKRKLSEAIMGEASQIDLFKNGKLQMVFNTRNYLYVIDRNGGDVEGFPVVFSSPATSPIAVFDYDRTREYRFFIAAEDRRVYAFDKAGKKLQGWEFDRTERVVSKPLQHFRAGSLDFIIIVDGNRPYFLDRRGKERIKPDQLFSPSRNGNMVLDNGAAKAATRFITTDSLGIVRFIYLDGRVEDLVLGAYSPWHFFDHLDVDGDGKRDFVFLDNKNLQVFNAENKQLFTTKFTDEPLSQVFYFQFGGTDRKLGVLVPKSSQIFLINGDGSLYKDFPLLGSTPFSIGQFPTNSSKFNLIVGSSSGFVLNYSVN
jgi:hypothetical protein